AVAHPAGANEAEAQAIEPAADRRVVFENLRIEAHAREGRELVAHGQKVERALVGRAGKVEDVVDGRVWGHAEGVRHAVAGGEAKHAHRGQTLVAPLPGGRVQVGQATHEGAVAAAGQNGVVAAIDELVRNLLRDAKIGGDEKVASGDRAAGS